MQVFRFTTRSGISNLNTGNITAEVSCTRTVLSSMGVATRPIDWEPVITSLAIDTQCVYALAIPN